MAQIKIETVLRIARLFTCGFGSAGLTLLTGFPADAAHSYIVVFASAIVFFYLFNLVIIKAMGIEL